MRQQADTKKTKTRAPTHRRLDVLVLDPKAAFKRRELRRASVCRAFFEYCDAQITELPAEGMQKASIAVRFAHLIGDDCLIARSFGILASAHRALGLLEKADIINEIARRRSCSGCLSDLKRRLAYLRCDQKRYDDAFKEIAESMDLYKMLKDLDGGGRALLCRGTIYWETGNVAAAVADYVEAIRLISPEKSILYHRAAVFNLTFALAAGKMVDAETALRKLQKVKPLFKGLRGFSAERAKLRWLEGIIMARLGCDQRAEDLLRKARTTLIDLKMPQEVAAITADLALLCRNDRRSVRSLARETSQLTWAMAHAHIGPALAIFHEAVTAKALSTEQMLTAANSLRQAVGNCGIAAPGFA